MWLSIMHTSQYTAGLIEGQRDILVSIPAQNNKMITMMHDKVVGFYLYRVEGIQLDSFGRLQIAKNALLQFL